MTKVHENKVKQSLLKLRLIQTRLFCFLYVCIKQQNFSCHAVFILVFKYEAFFSELLPLCVHLSRNQRLSALVFVSLNEYAPKVV